MTIQQEIGKLAVSTPVELFEIDMTALGGDRVFFHAGTNGLLDNVVWQGNEYVATAIEANGFSLEGSGQIPRPRLRVANVTSAISGFILNYDDLLGAKVIRRRTLVKFLDAVNFPGSVNADADPNEYLPDDIFFIDRRASENKYFVEFELAASYDVQQVKLPARQIIANVCPAVYRDVTTGCGWAPDPGTGPFFDRNDDPTDAAGDACGKRLTSCRARFGENQPLDYMGFPSAGLIKT